MQKKVLIPILASALVLSACSFLSPNEPKFMSYYNKTDYDGFSTALNNAANSFDFKLDDLQSFVSNDDIFTSTEATIKNNELKKDEVTSQKQREVYKFQYDKKNSILSVDRQKDTTILQEVVGSKQQAVEYSTNSSVSLQFEELEMEEEKDLIAFVKSNKSYYNLGEVGESESSTDINNIESVAMFGVSIPLLSYINGVALYENASQEEKEKFNFYVDGKVFTMVFVVEEEQVEENYTSKDTRDVKIQIVLNKNVMELAYKDVKKTVTTYLETVDGHDKGDVITESSTEYCTANLKQSNVKLSSLKRSSYTELEQTLDYSSLIDLILG